MESKRQSVNTTSGTWKKRLEALKQGSFPVFLVLSIAILCQACVSRNEIRATLWLNNGQDPAQCGPSRAGSPNPALWDYGFYRRLNSGGFEFISFCDPRSKDWFGVHRQDLERILDETLPKQEAQAVMHAIRTDRAAGARALQARARRLR